eukprot:2031753-Amphidinium_carterae.1
MSSSLCSLSTSWRTCVVMRVCNKRPTWWSLMHQYVQHLANYPSRPSTRLCCNLGRVDKAVCSLPNSKGLQLLRFGGQEKEDFCGAIVHLPRQTVDSEVGGGGADKQQPADASPRRLRADCQHSPYHQMRHPLREASHRIKCTIRTPKLSHFLKLF